MAFSNSQFDRANSSTTRNMDVASSLHEQVVAFAAQMAPSPEEQEQCEKIIELLRKLTYDTFNHDVELSAFGSYANGLATKHSDLDLVITGLIKPDTPGGFFGFKQHLVGERLSLLEQEITSKSSLPIQKVELIRHAKFPLLKILLEGERMVDITINDETATRAAHYILAKVRQFPCLRPLCLVLKSLLKSNQLGDVKNGGLGGFSLVNMVIAHLQERVKKGLPMHDYGDLLLSFLLRFGYDFDGEIQAVSVMKGGIVSKTSVYQTPERRFLSRRSNSGSSTGNITWFIQSPITALDTAQGSYNLHLVRDLFRSTYTSLSHIREKRVVSEGLLDSLMIN